MYPLHHLVLSTVAAIATVPFLGLSPGMTAVAVVLGIAAGVLVDVDHVLLPAVYSRSSAPFAWMRRPVRAFREPRSLLADVAYERMVLHRLLSHSTVLVAVYLVSLEFPVLVPAVAALIVHILADIVWDVARGNYREVLS